MRLASFTTPFALAIALIAPIQYAAAQGAPTLLTTGQREVERASIALFAEPELKAAREAVIKEWSALPPFHSKDGKAQLAGAVDELVYSSVRSAVESARQAPTIIWTETPPYQFGDLSVPGARWGIDLPDRIYRTASVDPTARYVIRGKRNASASNDDFLFEAASDRLVKTLASLPAKDIDVAADGSFTITADARPAAGRRNHLALPPETSSILIRDTLADWHAQLPNALTIERVDGKVASAPSAGEVKREALALIGLVSRFNATLFQRVAQHPVHKLVPVVRSLDDGVQGAVAGMTRFSLRDDEALVLTIDPQGAGYTNIQLTDPWARSIPYWNAVTSLSDRQAKVSADGTITFIVAPRDPGYFNWLSTNGLNDGGVTLRIEKVGTPDPATIVKAAKVVKLADLAAALPNDAPRITPAERKAQLAARSAAFARRLVD